MFVIPIGLRLLYGIATDQKAVAAVLAVCLLSLEESMGLVLAGLDMVMLVTHAGQRIWGGCATCVGVGYFLVAVKLSCRPCCPEEERRRALAKALRAPRNSCELEKERVVIQLLRLKPVRQCGVYSRSKP